MKALEYLGDHQNRTGIQLCKHLKNKKETKQTNKQKETKKKGHEQCSTAKLYGKGLLTPG